MLELLALAWQDVAHAPLRFLLPPVVLPQYRLHSLVFQFRRRFHNKPRYDHRHPIRLEMHRPFFYYNQKVSQAATCRNIKTLYSFFVPFLVWHEVTDDPCRVHRLVDTLP